MSCQIQKRQHTRVENPADHPGEHHEEHWQKFQVAT